MQTASLTPERQHLTPLFDWLLIAMERRRVKMHGTWISYFLAVLITRRIMDARQRFYRLVERIRAGKFRPRKPATPQKAPVQPVEKAVRKPPPKPGDPMFQKFGWMIRLMPGTEAGQCHRALQDMFADPELAPILAAAPGPIWRELRPLCWMFGVKRPTILAPPPRPKRAKRPKRRTAKRCKAPQAPKPAVQGPWVRIPSADWPPGVLDRPRKTTRSER